MNAPLLAYYGDDFTGSADVMEVLQWAGLRTVLFLAPPTPDDLARFDNLRAFGIAGHSRSLSTAELESEIGPVIKALRQSHPRFVHYKVCSTFDSSPEIGSIGRALEIGREICGTRTVPIVIAAPQLGRYQVFGNLFARSGLETEPFRLDRHPTMRQHPITPMNEADLRLHLANQTQLPVGLCDVLRLQQARQTGNGLSSSLNENDAACLFDLLVEADLPLIGRELDDLARTQSPLFTVGSSGVEYALTAHWEETGELASLQSHASGRPQFPAVEQLLAITGSCSPVNDRQIGHAEKYGFVTIPVHTSKLVHNTCAESETEKVVCSALDALRSGENVILHSARGPGDARVAETTEALKSLGMSDLDVKLHSGGYIGPKLGQILKRIVAEHPLPRLGVAGGDTSGFIARELGITALEAIAPVAPGSPLCKAHAENSLDGTEIFFKGGQVGRDDVWTTMLHGTANQT